MKTTFIKLAIASSIAATLAIAPSAFAGNGNKHWNNSGHGHKNSHNTHYKKNHHNKHSNRHHSKTKHIIGGIIGGVVLGSIIHNSRHNNYSTFDDRTRHHRTNYRYTNYNQYYDSQYYQAQSPVIINKTIVVSQTPTQTYRVLNGTDCYLVNTNNNGSEILTQVPNVNCGF